MMRRVAVFPAVLALAVTGVAAAGVASAEPVPPCSYTLSAPQVVQVSGASMVTATVSPAGCAAPSNPSLSVACLQLQGSDGPGLCADANGLGTAQVFAPYRPGTTYISSGKGCASTGNPARSLCDVVGPTTATL